MIQASWRRGLTLIIAFVLALSGVVMAGSPAQAAETADALPFKVGDGVVQVGCTWNNGCANGYHGAAAPAIDFIADVGTSVYAAGPGTLQGYGGCHATDSPGCNDAAGNYIEITHPDGRKSRYLHLASIDRGNGAVQRGDLIGKVGNSGADPVTSPPHLHYDEKVGIARVDPGVMHAMHGSSAVQYPNVLGYTGWNVVPQRTTFVWSDGGTRMMYANGASSAFVKDALAASWSQQAGNGDARAVAVGANGRMAYINGCGALYIKDVVADQWSQQSGCGDAQAMALGAARMAFITGCGGLGVKDSLAANWTWQAGCGDARVVRVAANDRLAYINGCGAAFVKVNIADSWSQQTGCGDARDIAVGGVERIALINGCGALYIKDGLVGVWSQQTGCNDAQKVSVGRSGRMAYINGCSAGFVKDNVGDPWSQQTGCGDAQQMTVGGSSGALTLITGCSGLGVKLQPADQWLWQAGCGDASSAAVQ